MVAPTFLDSPKRAFETFISRPTIDGQSVLGSAGWNDAPGKFLADCVGDEILFGLTITDGPERYLTAQPQRHFITIASTRSGKGTSLIIPNLLTYKGAALVIDPKGENAFLTARRRREMGQAVHVLDPWGEMARRYGHAEEKPCPVASYNPLSDLDPTSAHYTDDLGYICDALVINQGKEPHWDDSARELVAGVVSYCVETQGPLASLPMVRNVLTKGTGQIAQLAKEAEALGAESVAAKKLQRFSDPESKENGSIVSTALTQLGFLDNTTLQENLLGSSFSFADIVSEEGATVFLVLPVDKLTTYSRWLRLMVSIGIRSVARNTRRLDLPVLFVLDEFGTIGKLSMIAQAFGLMAGLQMCIWVFVQDLSQLKKHYPEDWETFIGNSEAVSFFGGMDNITLDYISKMLGQATATVKSTSTSSSTSTNRSTSTSNSLNNSTTFRRVVGFFFDDYDETSISKSGGSSFTTSESFTASDSTSHNIKYQPRFLLHADEIRRLNDNIAILIKRGQDPFLYVRVRYYEDDFFKPLAPQNPYYAEKLPPVFEKNLISINELNSVLNLALVDELPRVEYVKNKQGLGWRERADVFALEEIAMKNALSMLEKIRPGEFRMQYFHAGPWWLFLLWVFGILSWRGIAKKGYSYRPSRIEVWEEANYQDVISILKNHILRESLDYYVSRYDLYSPRIVEAMASVARSPFVAPLAKADLNAQPFQHGRRRF